MLLRSVLPVALALVALPGCTDRDAPRPATVFATPTPGAARPLSTREPVSSPPPATPVTPVTRPPSASVPATTGLPPGVPDPAEAGISDLARVARYVFREMRLNTEECPFANPLHDPLSFILHIGVEDGRMKEVHLARAGRRVGQRIEPLTSIPTELSDFAACLTPILEAVVMDPAPADGTYQPEYSYPGAPGP